MTKRINRILFFSKSKRITRTPRFFIKAFEKQGIEVKTINYRKLERRWGRYLTEKYILSTYYRFQPQLVFINTIDIPFKILAFIYGKTKVAIFLPDLISTSDDNSLPEVNTPYHEEMIERGKLSDYFFITNQGQIPFLKERGIKNPIFLIDGCDSEEHRIIPSKNRKWESDVAFIGRPADPFRIKLLQEVDKNFNLKVWGGDWDKYGLTSHKKEIYPKHYAQISSSAKIMLGVDLTDRVEKYFSNRTWITLGCGGFLLTRFVPGLGNFFVNKEHLVWYSSIDECLKLISEYLNNETERQRIRENGYRFVHENHTFDHAVKLILECVCQETILTDRTVKNEVILKRPLLNKTFIDMSLVGYHPEFLQSGRLQGK
jgi:hypothetical protein